MVIRRILLVSMGGWLIWWGVLVPSVFGQATQRLQAHRIQSSIAVDARLDEDAWEAASVATDFAQFRPVEGRTASQTTRVRVLYGPSDVYVGARLLDENPSGIRQTLGRRDDYNQADWFTVSIDSYFNQRTAYTFAVSAAGVQLDAIRSGAGRYGLDESWDAVWESEVRITPEGWIAELRIPYSMLRFSEADSTWGIQFTRRISRRGERVEWPLIPLAERENLIANYAHLTGLTDIEPRRNLQVRPYTVSQLQVEESSRQPGQMASTRSVDLGGDLKVGLSSNITLDATVNPDFGQVESDPAVLNLTAFETFYQEKRPFFLEGAEIYEFSLGRRSDLLYTRRIGAEAPIIGATKLSGRTAGGFSFGILGATTGESFQPSRNYGVARVSQQIGSYSTAGGILTGYDVPSGDGRYRSVVGGADWDLRFLDNAVGVDGFATVTHQRFNGPHGGPVTGIAGEVDLQKRRGIWRYDLGASLYDDNFDPNDLGRKRRNNYINLSTGLRHDINGGNAFGPFQRADAMLFLNHDFSYRNRLSQGLSYFFRSGWTTRGFQSIELGSSADYIFGGYDLFETRGLGPRARPFEVELETEIQSDERRSWQVEPEFGVTYYAGEGQEYTAGFRGMWNVGSRLSFQAGFDLAWENNHVAWAANETFRRSSDYWAIGRESAPPEDLGPREFERFASADRLSDVFAPIDPTAPNQYFVPVYGARDTRSLDLTMRSNVTLRPNLSVQFYGQLFLARGRYEDFQLLQDRDTLVPFDTYPKRDAFALSSMQINSVLRWEYRPGSTLYLVWTQGRRSDDELNPLDPRGPSPYNRSMDTQIQDVFDIFPRNVFLVKLDYTFVR